MLAPLLSKGGQIDRQADYPGKQGQMMQVEPGKAETGTGGKGEVCWATLNRTCKAGLPPREQGLHDMPEPLNGIAGIVMIEAGRTGTSSALHCSVIGDRLTLEHFRRTGGRSHLDIAGPWLLVSLHTCFANFWYSHQGWL